MQHSISRSVQCSTPAWSTITSLRGFSLANAATRVDVLWQYDTRLHLVHHWQLQLRELMLCCNMVLDHMSKRSILATTAGLGFYINMTLNNISEQLAIAAAIEMMFCSNVTRDSIWDVTSHCLARLAVLSQDDEIPSLRECWHSASTSNDLIFGITPPVTVDHNTTDNQPLHPCTI